MKTKKFDSNWEKILTGEMTLEEWWEQAEDGQEIDVSDEELKKRDDEYLMTEEVWGLDDDSWMLE